LFAQFEFDSAFLHGRYPSTPYDSTRGDVEFLSYASAQNADEMIGMRAGDSGLVS